MNTRASNIGVNVISIKFIKFAIIGLLSTTVDWLTYLILINHIYIDASKGIGYLCGTSTSFYCNSKFNFQEKGKIGHFYFVYFFTFTLNVFLNKLLLNSFNLNVFASLFIVTICTTVVNYLLVSRLVFIRGYKL